jgi:hypothetical protein
MNLAAKLTVFATDVFKKCTLFSPVSSTACNFEGLAGTDRIVPETATHVDSDRIRPH